MTFKESPVVTGVLLCLLDQNQHGISRMIHFTKGNLLEANVEALVNTVNSVGVMGKGIALMFKERFPKNYREYVAASKIDAIQVGKMFISATDELYGPKWVINFPTKKHWRYPTKIEWVRAGLMALRDVIREKANQVNCSASSWLWKRWFELVRRTSVNRRVSG